MTDADEVLHQAMLRSKQYICSRLVSVVTRQYFDEWLTHFETDANALAQKITSQRAKLDRQLELLEKNRIHPD